MGISRRRLHHRFSWPRKPRKPYQDQVSSPNRMQIMALEGFAFQGAARPKWPMAIWGTSSWNIETPSSPSCFLASKTYLSPQVPCFYLFSFSRYCWLKNFTLGMRPLNSIRNISRTKTDRSMGSAAIYMFSRPRNTMVKTASRYSN